MQKKKENTQLEKEDPRKAMYGINEYNLIKSDSSGVDKYLLIDCIKSSQIILCKDFKSEYEEKNYAWMKKVEESIKVEQSSTLNSNKIDLKLSSSSSSILLSSTEISMSYIEICKPSKF
ncbi:unnamed protein product [Cunninghamella blakesleeana]